GIHVLQRVRPLPSRGEILDPAREGQEAERTQREAHDASSHRRDSRTPLAPPNPSELFRVTRGRPSGARTRFTGHSGSWVWSPPCTGRNPRSIARKQKHCSRAPAAPSV